VINPFVVPAGDDDDDDDDDGVTPLALAEATNNDVDDNDFDDDDASLILVFPFHERILLPAITNASSTITKDDDKRVVLDNLA